MDKVAKQLFTEMLKESGMPVNAAEAKAVWNKTVEGEGSLITNNSAFSPFWRIVEALITRPVLWVNKLLVEHALPNVFLRFAGGMWLDVFAWGVDVKRKDAEFAQGEVLFTRSGTSGVLTIPAGTVVESPALNGVVYRVATLEESFIPDGALGAKIAVKAEKAGGAWNLGPGYFSILAKPVPGVVSVSNNDNWLKVPGADQEDDEALRLRCQNQFAAVGQYHHDAGYKALIAAYAGIRTDYIYFQKEAPRGPGTANGFIMIESGVPPQDFVDSINTFIRESGNHGHGDDMLCMPITPLPVDLEASVYPVIGLDETACEVLKQDVENHIRCAFRQNTNFLGVTKTLPLSRFSFSRLADELHDKLPNLRSVVFNQTDIVAYLALPTLVNLKVNLEGGL